MLPSLLALLDSDAATLLLAQEWLKTTGSPASHIEKCTISDEKSDLKELSYSSFETRR